MLGIDVDKLRCGQLGSGLMGVELNVAEFLIAAHRRGVNFGRVCTLGHQDLLITTGQLAAVLKRHGVEIDRFDEYFPWAKPQNFADNLFRILGAEDVVSLDNSPYEGATLIHDMNVPIPARLHEQFDTVFDGGALEHIFRFPVAIENCMRMVKVGGHFISQTAANNYCGHGFYQFSPELFYRIFSPSNGFTIERLVLCEWDSRRWFETRDPAVIQKRVELVNAQHTAMLVVARRTSLQPIFEETPQQSDYSEAWQMRKPAGEREDGLLKARLRRLLGPRGVERASYYLNILRMWQQRRLAQEKRRLSNLEAYTQVPRG